MGKQILYVVDADPTARASVERLLRALGYEVRAFASAPAFLAAYDGFGGGCVVLDLPGGARLDLLARLQAIASPLAALVVTRPHDVTGVVAAIKQGAFDVIVKPGDARAVQSAVSAALHESAIRWAAFQERAALRHRFDTLTPREREVCHLVASGYLNKQAAYELGTAEKTIKVHRARVMSKLQVGSVAELVRLVDHLATAPRPTGTTPQSLPAAS
jgi:FixJ family two-component response regulator